MGRVRWDTPVAWNGPQADRPIGFTYRGKKYARGWANTFGGPEMWTRQLEQHEINEIQDAMEYNPERITYHMTPAELKEFLSTSTERRTLQKRPDGTLVDLRKNFDTVPRTVKPGDSWDRLCAFSVVVVLSALVCATWLMI